VRAYPEVLRLQAAAMTVEQQHGDWGKAHIRYSQNQYHTLYEAREKGFDSDMLFRRQADVTVSPDPLAYLDIWFDLESPLRSEAPAGSVFDVEPYKRNPVGSKYSFLPVVFSSL
jgi:hypothetical protein